MRSTNTEARTQLAALALAMLALAGLYPTAHGQDNERRLMLTLQEQERVDSASQQSQNNIDRLAEQTSDYFADFRVASQQLEQLKVYNNNLERLVADQQSEKRSIERQLTEFSEVEKGIVPLMYQLIDDLENFIRLDMPFLKNERGDRVLRLRRNMERSDLTVSEKYRQIMDAYQIESGYGRTIEAYAGSLDINGEERTVDLLRIGRIVLAYQTPDRAITGVWDQQTGTWADVGDDFRRAVTDGIRVARKQAAPMLLELPVPAAEDVQ